MVGLALCAVTALRLAWPAAQRPAPEPAPSYAPGPDKTLVFLGDGQDSWCAPLFDDLRPWAAGRGWSLIAYDCAGSVKTQRGQLEDLLRTESATAAILYDLGDGAWQTEAVELLEEAGIQTVTLSRWGEADVGPDTEGLQNALEKEFAPTFLGTRRDVLLVVDLPEEGSTQAARDALSRTFLNVVEYGSCWSSGQYAKEYVVGALERHPSVSAVLCLSREGAEGAAEALTAVGERHEVAVLCLDQSPETEEDLALGRIDAVAAVSREGVLDALGQALEGQAPKPLDVQIRTAPED